jgi:superfamily I DNA/RNA helicase/DNA polymerase III epsilon subunit-like protein
MVVAKIAQYTREKFNQFISSLKYPPNKFQYAVLDKIAFGSGNITVDAKAGAGKTQLLIMVANLLLDMGVDPSEVIFQAFNKSIEEELNERLPRGFVAKTSHSLGLSMCREYATAKGIKIGKLSDKKYKDIANYIAERIHPSIEEQDKRFKAMTTVSKLINFIMANDVDPKDVQAVEELAYHYALEVTPAMVTWMPYAIEQAIERFQKFGEMDFIDMIYMPVKLKMEPKNRYRFVLTDECLPYLTPIQLADGTSMTIGDIVEQKLPVEVLAYDTVAGQQKTCRVTGWSKTLNQKPLVKIKVKWTQGKPYKGGMNKPTNFVVCTTDHKVWANGQWLYAGDVQVGMKMQVETSAIKSQAYKITQTGRNTLANVMSAKNDAGLMVQSGSNKGKKFANRGGNGQGFTLAQQVLLEALGEGWHAEYSFSKRGMRKAGYPSTYKIDIANPERMIAIEIDGHSHHAKQVQEKDKKKQSFLESNGWTVYRFTNREAIQQTSDCLSKLVCTEGDCPIDAIVVSVEPVSIPDNYVYDITVEDCHNFYANGILVHNCQDLNGLQQEIAGKLLHPEGRIIFCGDPNQSIYAFAGADSQAFYNLNTRFNTQVLELNICYRCPTSHIELAQSLVPTIEAAPGAIQGEIEFKHLDTLPSMPLGSMVICRLNAPLFAAYFQFIAQEKPAVIIGRDMGKGLLALVDKIATMEGFRYYNIAHFIERYADMEEAKLEKKPNAASKIAQLTDQITCLNVCVENFDCDNLECFKEKLEALFVDFKDKNLDKSKVVTLCTVHRAKGLEADHIGLIYQRNSNGEFKNIMPLTWEKQREWELEQEFNIKYVAFTRAKKVLTLFGGYKEGDAPEITDGRNMQMELDLEEEDFEEDEYEIESGNKVYHYPGEALDEYEEEYEMEELEMLMDQPSNFEEALQAKPLSLAEADKALYAPVEIADFAEEEAGTPIPQQQSKNRCSTCKGTGTYQEAMCRACEGRGIALYELEDHDPELNKEIAEAMMSDPTWKTFVYGMSRPCMYGTCPNDFLSLYEHPEKGYYVDYAAYNRKLNREEMKHFEMQPVSASAWDVQIGDKVFTTGRIEWEVKEHLKNGKVVIEVEIDGRKESQIEHQWDLTPAKALANGLAPKPFSLGDLVLLNPELPTDKGTHNRAVKIATMLQDAGLWDGKIFIRFENAFETHKRVIGFEHLDLNKLVLSEKDGEILVSLPAENSPEGEKVAEAAPVVEEVAPPDDAADKTLWAKWLLSQKERVVILDTETTDFQTNLPNFEMVQIGAINLDGEEVLNRFIVPYVSRITDGAAAVHEITHAVLSENGATSLISQYQDVKAALQGKIVIAYNSPFDKAALENSLKLCGLDPIEIHSWHCAMRMYAKHNPNKADRRGKLGTNWKLTEAVAQQGLAVDDNAHDALADVRMTLALIKSMAADEPNRWQSAKAQPAPKVERPYQENDLVLIKASGKTAEVKKLMPNEELSLSLVEDGSRVTLSKGMVSLMKKAEDRAKPEESAPAPVESEEQTNARADVRSMDLNGKQVRLDDGQIAEVIEAKGKKLTIVPEGEETPIKISRDELFSVITTPAPAEIVQPEPAPEPVPVVTIPAAPKQSNPYTQLERLVSGSFENRADALAFLEILGAVIDEKFPEEEAVKA